MSEHAARERRLAELATAQAGVNDLDQLRESGGLSGSAALKRAATGRLHRLHQGVYARGHQALGRNGSFHAAVLAGGPGAALSHRSAAHLHDIRICLRSVVEITVPTRNGRRQRPGLHIHRSPLGPDDLTEVEGVRVTEPSRTLLDLAAVIPIGVLRRAVSRTDKLKLLDFARLQCLMDGARGRRGVANLRKVLRTYQPSPHFTRSEREERLIGALRRAGAPTPLVNHGLTVADTWMEVDLCWPRHRLAFEVDGPSHELRATREDDAAREQHLAAAGWRIARATETQIDYELHSVVGLILRALAHHP